MIFFEARCVYQPIALPDVELEPSVFIRALERLSVTLACEPNLHNVWIKTIKEKFLGEDLYVLRADEIIVLAMNGVATMRSQANVWPQYIHTQQTIRNLIHF